MKTERNDTMAKEKKKKDSAEAAAKDTQEKDTDKKPEAAKAEKAEKKEKPEKAEAVKEQPSKEELLQKQLNEKNDQLLRIAAEYDNFRKRSQREKEALYAECKSTVIKDLLPVVDNFDRVFANPDSSFEDYKKGVEMTYKQFNETFKKLGVEPFGEIGDEFDPNLHNAVMHSEDENAEENTIANVLAKGYKIGDKIIRPAMVAVVN
jgi:molecular chaperone GrpE